MIIEYHRPATRQEALELLARTQPTTLAIGGGTVLNQPGMEQVAVVDVQALGLDNLEAKGSTLRGGAAVKLQALLDFPGLPEALYAAIRHEATQNLRQMATLAGTVVAADGRSALTTVLLALGAMLEMHSLAGGKESLSLGDLLPMRKERLGGRLITELQWPCNVKLAYEYVARTPADLPIVCAAAAQWSGGRTRLALGGYGAAPVLVMDGPEANGAVEAAKNAYLHASDPWASAEYRSEMAGVLARRCLEHFTKG
ncbi:MAG: FAD binding domain-containing protein [Anaerolineales bacterium]|nr:FAD binding domain-containing protein [Anaerolineales bacterium]